MRIGSLTLAQQGLSAILDKQSQIARVQAQISSGRKDASAADNPADFSAGIRIDEALSQLQRYQANGELVSSRLGLEDGALQSISASLQRVRDLAVQANNVTQSDSSRQSIVAELRQLQAALLDSANSQDGQGRYLFAGAASASQPFTETAGAIQYSGDDSRRQVTVAPGVTLADGDSGYLFLEIPSGNGHFDVRAGAGNTGSASLKQTGVSDSAQWDGGDYSLSFTSASSYEVRDGGGALVVSGSYSAGQAISFNGAQLVLQGTPAAGDSFAIDGGARTDLFSIVGNLITTLSAPAGTAAREAARQNGVFSSLGTIDRALDQLLDARADVGARINRLDDLSASQQSLSLQLTKTLDGVRSTDLTAAISQLQFESTALQAAQQSFIKLQGLSLFNYLR